MPLPAALSNLPLPIIGSPLFIISTPKLVIAQCIAGVVGSMPALNARPAEQLEEWLIEITETLAAYNAGPGRPRSWRGQAGAPSIEAAIWAENVPFTETRDYVKKVLSNSIYYAAVLGQTVPTLKSRLGKPIGPRDPTAPAPDKDIP